MSRAPAPPLVVGEVRGEPPAGRALRVDAGATDLLVAPGRGGLARAADDVPEASTRPAGSRCYVLAARGGGVLGWLRGAERLGAGDLCALLVARGYADVGAGEVEGLDLAWGAVPAVTGPS